MFSPPQVKAILLALQAALDVAEGALEQARIRLAEALKDIQPARDMPVNAVIAVQAANLALAEGDARLAAELLGDAVNLRGLEDLSDPAVRRVATGAEAVLGAEAYQEAQREGVDRSRADALALLEAALN